MRGCEEPAGIREVTNLHLGAHGHGPGLEGRLTFRWRPGRPARSGPGQRSRYGHLRYNVDQVSSFGKDGVNPDLSSSLKVSLWAWIPMSPRRAAFKA